MDWVLYKLEAFVAERAERAAARRAERAEKMGFAEYFVGGLAAARPYWQTAQEERELARSFRKQAQAAELAARILWGGEGN